MSQRTPKRPLRVFRAGNIKAVIFRDVVQRHGRTNTRYCVRLLKTLHDKQTGRSRDTSCFLDQDLPAMIFVAQKAHRLCATRRKRQNRGTADRRVLGGRGGMPKRSSRKPKAASDISESWASDAEDCLGIKRTWVPF